MVRHHAGMVQDRTKMINRIRSMPTRHNATVEGTACAAKNLPMSGAVRLGSPHDRKTVVQCAKVVRRYTDQTGKPDGRTGTGVGRNGHARLPVGMTGVGPHVALLLVAGVGGRSSLQDQRT